MPIPCSPEELLKQFLAEQLTPELEDDLETHLGACGACRDRLERLTEDAVITPYLLRRAGSPLSTEFAERLEDSLRNSTRTAEADLEPGWPRVEGYELLDVLDRGGSSTVYRARDQRLCRLVAIKVPHDRLNSVDRERFRREATALAALRHPNILLALDAGESHERPYLVMEFIPGGSLSRFIAGQPQPPLSAARLTFQLAGAIHAAHAAGFVHRDLKPSNILLDPQVGRAGETGLDRYVPKVTDLGIVKDLNRDEDFTQARDYLGTPSYMAPEQVDGPRRAVDCRTDVYALGALLYELLTGRPPFRAGSPLDTMLLVKQDDPVPPSRFHPKLPRDLETICLKCLEKDPSRRYQSAQLLADDLNHFLQGRPIVARRTSWPGILWRWSQRNPGWAAVALITTAIIIALAVGGPFVAQREHLLREQALSSKREAQKERDRATEQFLRASQVLANTLDQTLISSRLQGPMFDELRAGLVRTAVPYCEQFLGNDSSSRSARLPQGRMLAQLAGIYLKEGMPEKARSAYLRSLERLEPSDGPAFQPDRQIRVGLAQFHVEYGRFLQMNDKDLVGAEDHYRRAVSLLAEPLERDARDRNLRDQTAIALSLWGVLISPAEDRAGEAEAMLTRAAAIRDQLAEEFPHQGDLQHYAALTHMNLGLHYRVRGNRQSEIQELQRAWGYERKLMDSAAQSSEAPYYAALLEGELGRAFDQAGRRDDAVRHLESALRIAQALRRAFPAVEKFSALQQDLEDALMPKGRERATADDESSP